jgi:hypothetical protein
MGDGIGSVVGAFFGGCPNTTYGESIATVAITRNASTISIWGAAIACILFSMVTPLFRSRRARHRIFHGWSRESSSFFCASASG